MENTQENTCTTVIGACKHDAESQSRVWNVPTLLALICGLIIQQIVTLSKYGHDALDICHP